MREVWNMKVVFLGVVLVGLVSLRTLGARPLVERTAADGLDFGFAQKGEDGGVLVVRGLKPGRYRLLKDGYPAGVWRADEFATGIDLDKIEPLPGGAGKPKSYRLTLKPVIAIGVDSLLPKPRKITVSDGHLSLSAGGLEALNVVTETDSSIPPEGYCLQVGSNGVRIASSDAAGAFYARQTLEQLIGGDGATLPFVEIEDAPAYRWRGLLIDEARHFIGFAAVKRLIDQMAKYKFNVLHWHLTDDTGWRLEIKSKPRLLSVGAVRPWSTVRFRRGEEDGVCYGPYYYTQKEAKEIVAYAAARHITVVPEIEFPGHSIAAIAAYPELSCLGESSPVKYPYQPFTSKPDVLCPGKDATIRFLEDVLDELCEIFPSKMIHIGGDECVKESWKSCPHCQARMKANGLGNVEELQGWMTRHFADYLASKGRRAIGWDEILEGGSINNATVMSWRGVKGGIAAVMSGHETVMTPCAYCYYDYGQGLEDDPYEYIGGRITLEQAYSFDPVEGIPIDRRGFVLGGQANNWGEYTFNEYDLSWKLWPRALALAEVLWTAPAVRDYFAFAVRARIHRKRLVSEGVNAAPCDHDLR